MEIINYFKITPPEISEHLQLLRDISKENEKFDLDTFTMNSKRYIAFLNKVYKEWFPRAKKYSDNYIAEHLFLSELEIKTWVNINLISLIKTVKRIHEKIIRQIMTVDFVSDGVINFYKEIVFDSIEFLNLGYLYISGEDSGNHTHRRRNIRSHEIFENSKRLVLKDIYTDDIVTIPSAIFFIRQSIEIRLKNAFGIASVVNSKGEYQKITGDQFLSLIDEKSTDIEFPLKKSLVSKIHSWTNYYIHGAVIFYYWHIEWAHYILEPLFLPGEVGNMLNISGSIKMKRSYYEDIEQRIKILFKNSELKINRMNNPEAIIID